MPQDLTIVSPGQGEITTPEVAGLPAAIDAHRPVQHGGDVARRTTPSSPERSRGRRGPSGGLPVTLTWRPTPRRPVRLGPGAVTLTGAAGEGLPGRKHRRRRHPVGDRADGAARRPTGDRGDRHRRDRRPSRGRGGVRGRDRVPRSPQVPTDGGGRDRSDARNYDELDRIMAGFVRRATPTPAIVQNGNGERRRGGGRSARS